MWTTQRWGESWLIWCHSARTTSFKCWGWAGLNAWAYTSVRTSLGHLKPHSSWRGLSSGCTSWGGCGSLARCQKSRNFNSYTVESILISCITMWYKNASAVDHICLQRVVRTAEKIIRTPLPSLQSIYHHRAACILKDLTHPQHRLFTLLLSGWSFRSLPHCH